VGPLSLVNINFARLYDRLGTADSRPSNMWCGDDEARETVEQVIRDAGYDPVYAGPLENAGDQERFIKLAFAINQGGMGAFFYRIAPPDQF
jgi:predicted dinucleotide-binding enzyme